MDTFSSTAKSRPYSKDDSKSHLGSTSKGETPVAKVEKGFTRLQSCEDSIYAMIPPRKTPGIACTEWLVAASKVNETKHTLLTDSKGRGADDWKYLRGESCRWMFYCAMFGVGTAMWSDYILFMDHQEPSAR